MDKELTTSSRGKNPILLGIICGLLSISLGAMSLFCVSGAMNADLRLSWPILHFSVSLTPLVCGMGIVLMGGLGDRLGHDRILRLGMILAIVGSLLVGLAPGRSPYTILVLLTGRLCQGLGAACVIPSTLALLRILWEDRRRQQPISLWSMGSWGGLALSTLFGLYVTEWLSWRWICWIAAGMALLGLILIWRLPHHRPKERQSQGGDIPGVVTLLIGIVSLQLYATQSTIWGWLDTKSLVLLLVATVFLLLFVAIEQRARDPLLDLRIFRSPIFSGATVVGLLLTAAAAITVLVSSLQQLAAGIPAHQVGLMTIWYGGTILVLALVAGRVMQLHGARLPMLLSTVLVGAALCLLLGGTSDILVAVAYLLLGAGQGLLVPTLIASAIAALPERYGGVGSGILMMGSLLGGSLGLLLVTEIVEWSGSSTGPAALLPRLAALVEQPESLTIHQGALAACLSAMILVVIAFGVIYFATPKRRT